MKVNQMLVIGGVAAALFLSAGSLSAQDNNTGDGGGQGRGRRGNFDPAQMQQRMMERVREDLGFTNDTDWNAVQPLVQKVMDARRDLGFPGRGMNRMGRRGDAGGPGPGQGARARGMFGQPSPEAEALQKAVDANAPTAQIKAALEKYRASQKDKQAKLRAAQDNLRKVLSVKQEAQAELLGLLQ